MHLPVWKNAYGIGKEGYHVRRVRACGRVNSDQLVLVRSRAVTAFILVMVALISSYLTFYDRNI